MNVRLKKAVSLILAIVLCLSVGITASAAGDSADADVSIGLFWTHTTSVSVSLSIAGGKASCGATVIGKSGTTKITGTAELALKNSDGTYTVVKEWSGLEAAGDTLIFDGTYYVSTGYTYKLTITATVYRNGGSETVSGSFSAYAS